ncbi:MAG: S-layer family protein, partial [Symploca sp. SIO2B6]|nr:S-layer family protein [Symploca sp. SIO2B6]
LQLTNNAAITSSTAGQGDAGIIQLRVTDDVLLSDSEISSAVDEIGEGEGGDVNITANTLEVISGSQLLASTAGAGNAGNIVINVRDRLTLDGTGPRGNSSGIFANTEESSTGRGGIITITAPNLQMMNSAIIDARTDNHRAGGGITVEADQIDLVDGAQFITSTSAGGQAGDLTLNAETINIAGSDFTLVDTESEAGNTVLTDVRRNSGLFANTQPGSTGNGGRITLTATDVILDNEGIISTLSEGDGNAGPIVLDAARTLRLSDRAQITSSTEGQGNTGRIFIQAGERISLNQQSTISSAVLAGASGNSQQIVLQTPQLSILGGSQISAETFGEGNAGTIQIQGATSVVLDNSAILTTVNQGARSTEPSRIEINTRSLQLTNNAAITSSTAGQGDAGIIQLQVGEALSVFNSEISSEVTETGDGEGGDIFIDAETMTLGDRALITAQSLRGLENRNSRQRAIRFGGSQRQTTDSSDALSNAGNIIIAVDDILLLEDSDITTQAALFAGGQIDIQARDIRLLGDSDIQTNVQTGSNNGGNITLTADTILMFDDSDILAFAADGQGGDIALNTPAFFGEGFTLSSLEAEPNSLDGNNQVDLNATGAVAGVVSLPDVSALQNSLSELPEGLINTDRLIANSCVLRTETGRSTFIITGREGLRSAPSDPGLSFYPTGEVQTVVSDVEESRIEEETEWAPPSDTTREQVEDVESTWQRGDPIIEPQSVYQLPDGSLVLSHECR